MKRLHEIENLLKQLEGVIRVERVRQDDIPGIKVDCPIHERDQMIDVVHIGLQDVLERDTVFILLKDVTFRPPPVKTVYMVEDVKAGDAAADHLLSAHGRKYHVIGEEIFDRDTELEENHILLGNGFALFPGRRKETRNVPAYFLIPAIGFPELEERSTAFGIQNVMSVSPSTSSDQILRGLYGFEENPEFATILVGFDRAGS